jgi:hypothetical protein
MARPGAREPVHYVAFTVKIKHTESQVFRQSAVLQVEFFVELLEATQNSSDSDDWFPARAYNCQIGRRPRLGVLGGVSQTETPLLGLLPRWPLTTLEVWE